MKNLLKFTEKIADNLIDFLIALPVSATLTYYLITNIDKVLRTFSNLLF